MNITLTVWESAAFKLFCILLFLLLISCKKQSQLVETNTGITFINLPYPAKAYCVKKVNNEYFIAGSIYNTSKKNLNDGLILCLNENFKLKWYNNYGGLNNDWFKCIDVNEHGIVAAGGSFSYTKPGKDKPDLLEDGFVVFTDKSGNMKSQQFIYPQNSVNGINADRFNDVLLNDTVAWLVGYTENILEPSFIYLGDTWFVNITNSGNVHKQFNTTTLNLQNDEGKNMIKLTDNTSVVFSESLPNNSYYLTFLNQNYNDTLLVQKRIDMNFTNKTIYHKMWKGFDNINVFTAFLNNSRFLYINYSFSFNGELLKNDTINFSEEFVYVKDIVPVNDNIIFCGSAQNDYLLNSSKKPFIESKQIDNYITNWSKLINFNGTGELTNIIKNDKGFTCFGNSSLFNKDNIFIVRFSNTGEFINENK
ncbi:MAG: hypothetical protein ACK4K9_01835 [Bacteroidia bacterium]